MGVWAAAADFLALSSGVPAKTRVDSVEAKKPLILSSDLASISGLVLNRSIGPISTTEHKKRIGHIDLLKTGPLFGVGFLSSII